MFNLLGSSGGDGNSMQMQISISANRHALVNGIRFLLAGLWIGGLIETTWTSASMHYRNFYSKKIILFVELQWNRSR